MNPNPLNEYERNQCGKRLNAALESPEIAVVVLATLEGRRLAFASHVGTIDSMQIAALSGMLSSLGSNLADGAPSSVICICDIRGYPVVVVSAGRMLLTVVGHKSANIGMVAGVAGDVARDLHARIGNTGNDVPPASEERFQFDADGFTERVLSALEQRKARPAD